MTKKFKNKRTLSKKMKKKGIIIFLVIIVLALGWYLLSPLWRVIEIQEASPLDHLSEQEIQQFQEQMKVMKDQEIIQQDIKPQATLLKQADFIANAHEVQGKALLIQQEGKKIIRFEDFETVNGPDLHIYLAKDVKAKEYIDLGKIKATKGNVNYDVPENIDLLEYNTVLVWCQPFKVLFSYAKF